MHLRVFFSLAVFTGAASGADAFVSLSSRSPSTTLHLQKNSNEELTVSRRSLVDSFLTTAAASLVIQTAGPAPAVAAAKTNTYDADKAKLSKGYQRLNYLLDNWEKETTICKTGVDTFGGGCDRSPMKVMEYLGFRSINDPLFNVEKTLMRLQDDVPDESAGAYQDAMERIAEKAEEGSGMAFISSWGEANPGGGKDRVALFIERSKKDVIAVRDDLGTILAILK